MKQFTNNRIFNHACFQDDEEDYEDEAVDTKVGKVEPEEDPKVIKELIELIKKAGGIEELERQLNLSSDSSGSSGSTTQSSISKSLYERVLSKAGRSPFVPKKNSYTSIRNSSGPQSEATEAKSTSSRGKSDRGKLQYTSIARSRPSTTKAPEVDDEDNEDDDVDADVDVDIDDDVSEDEEDDSPKSRKSYSKPNYVNIRRPRVSSTTESEVDSYFSRNKILGELVDDDIDLDDIDVNLDEYGEHNNRNPSTPQYVNIRRQRPSTTEGPSTSRYVEIRRSTTESSSAGSEEDSEGTTSKYHTIRRGTTTPGPTEEDTASSTQGRRGTSTSVITTVGTEGTTKKYSSVTRESSDKTTKVDGAVKSQTAGVSSETGEITAVSANPEKQSGSTVSIGTTTPYNLNTDSINDIITTEPTSSTKTETISSSTTPQQPTTRTTRFTSTSTEENTIQTKRPIVRSTTVKAVSESSPKSRPNFLIGSRRRPSTIFPAKQPTATAVSFTPTSTAAPLFSPRPTLIKPRRKYLATTPGRILESQVFASRLKPDNRFRFVPRKPIISRTTSTTTTTTTTTTSSTASPVLETDQVKESSNQQSLEQDFDDQKDKTTELAEVAAAVQKLQKVQPQTTPLKRKTEAQRIKITTNVQKNKNRYRGPGQFLVNRAVITTPQAYHTAPARLNQRFDTTTPTPATTIAIPTATFRLTPNVRPQPFAKISLTTPMIYQPIVNPVYYDTVQPQQKITEFSKVLIHANGVIECLDQGSFPHPISCKKFISCAKMEGGQLLGWEYTCPKELSFDPIGGMCNWSADVGCNE
ncbi:unnamed protein product [Callosobruchus maculatus]|uniref:Chitin-binding type-2 domain-containing protein n=1 Tax=Callosobruchus maculatus TaxID=64391 RepID=A0A653BJ35_CALMS|nr:unnamed protein product [Callosobruchus maculatus]